MFNFLKNLVFLRNKCADCPHLDTENLICKLLIQGEKCPY
jgi:hypothetical protein